MKIANIANMDLCSIGTSLSRGLRELGDDARTIMLTRNPQETEIDLLWSRDEALARDVLKESDVLHVHSPIVGFTLSFRRPPFDVAALARKRRLVFHYHGSEARRLHPSVKGLIQKYRIPVFVTVPDLLRYTPGAEWLPLPVPSGDPKYGPANPPSSPIRVCHAPTAREIKKTDAFLEAMRRLQKSYDVEPVLIEGKPYAECLAIKRGCHINFDNIGYGSYALASIESMLMEQPSLVYLDGSCRTAVSEASDRVGIECPLLQVGDPTQPSHAELNSIRAGKAAATYTEEDVDSIYRQLEPLIVDDGLRTSVGRKSRQWAQAVHDERRVAEMASLRYGALAEFGGFSRLDRASQSFWWAEQTVRFRVGRRLAK